MGAKEIEVTCPCCRTLLRVDVATARATASSPAEGAGEDSRRPDPARWDAAEARVRQRSGRAAEQLEEGLSREREREQRLDDLFDSTRRKLEERAEDEP